MTSAAVSLDVLEQAAASAWGDFLCNRVDQAERRAAGWLHLLPGAIAAADDAELLVTLADLAHIAGAARADEPTLRQALAAYGGHLSLKPENLGALRMKAETLLRLGETAEAFKTFDIQYQRSIELLGGRAAQSAAEVAPFRLLHDAECVEAAALGGWNFLVVDSLSLLNVVDALKGSRVL